MSLKIPSLLLVVISLASCKNEPKHDPLMRLVSPQESGVTFSNDIHENDSVNILKMEYVYNGGGVGIGDFNNDGLSDIFFTSNQDANKLYLNKGGLHFEDITDVAGVAGLNKWKSGLALGDVNQDGLLDIYVCATLMKDSVKRKNMLFINQGLNPAGIPTFEDKAAQYGLDDSWHSHHAAFLDYDKDGDLDLYIVVNTQVGKKSSGFFKKTLDGTSPTNDRLYRNNGNGTFTNVTRDAGILAEGFGLGIAIADFNNDSWPDIYVSNDYLTNDLLYINNRNGTFTDQINNYIKHQSQFCMGNDVADFNNDAFPDIITLDMLPETNLRRKTVIAGASYTTYVNNASYGYAPQHIRNMLQLNNGNGTFSEIGQLAGIYQTEWSWSPLFADIDNDGNKDLLITNGFPKDVTDRDFGMYRSSQAGAVSSTAMLLDSIPVVKVSNYAYRNKGDLTFEDVTDAWGMLRPCFSNGAAFADFDNDGDLDYVINNINETAHLYENTLYSKNHKGTNHFIRIKLIGKNNESVLGTKIILHYGHGKIQYYEQSVCRGYISSVEDIAHFGVAKDSVIDSVIVQWTDGKIDLLKNVKSNQQLVVRYADESTKTLLSLSPKYTPFLKETTSATKINYVHQEDDIIDFNIQRTLPHKFSQCGPGLAVGDINGDKLEDFFVGSSAGNSSFLFKQKADGTFESSILANGKDKKQEDEGALFFDADNDGDLDLYIVGGSIEWQPDSPSYQDRLYKNDGKGNFGIDMNALPSLHSSKSCVRAIDFDKDGDLDLFTAGRVIPGKYPLAPSSYILQNNNGKFIDVTAKICSALSSAGMITDAIWSDYDNDGNVDLIVVGEFMPIKIFRNNNGTFEETTGTNLESYSGWYNSIAASDFDHDGDVDYVVGNLGLNNYYHASAQYPLKIFAKDIDGNSSIDAIMACYFKAENGEMELFPAHFWEELNSQSPKFRRKFRKYSSYGKTNIEKLLKDEDRSGMVELEATYTATSFVRNLGNGKFEIKPLPVLCQTAPVNGMIVDDLNNDGHSDILMVGNDFGNEVFSGRYDAFTGLAVLGNGAGEFNAIPSVKSGFFVDGDAKALARLAATDRDLYIVTQNRDTLKTFAKTVAASDNFIFSPESNDLAAELVYDDGTKSRVEFYFGSGYLSQSSRSIRVGRDVKQLTITNSRGVKRQIPLTNLALVDSKVR